MTVDEFKNLFAVRSNYLKKVKNDLAAKGVVVATLIDRNASRLTTMLELFEWDLGAGGDTRMQEFIREAAAPIVYTLVNEEAQPIPFSAPTAQAAKRRFIESALYKDLQIMSAAPRIRIYNVERLWTTVWQWGEWMFRAGYVDYFNQIFLFHADILYSNE